MMADRDAPSPSEGKTRSGSWGRKAPSAGNAAFGPAGRARGPEV